MTPHETIQSLLTTACCAAAVEEKRRIDARQLARAAWITELIATHRAASRKVDAAWDRILEALPENLPDEDLEEIPDPPEQAELGAVQALMDAVREKDMWPRELYWSL